MVFKGYWMALLFPHISMEDCHGTAFFQAEKKDEAYQI